VNSIDMTKRKFDNNGNAYNKKTTNLLQINPLMSIPKLALVLTGLMALTGLIYCIAALEESTQAGKEVAAKFETIFFTTVALAYFGVAAWMFRVKKRFTSRLPYTISIIGSAALIAIYVSSRIINFPIVGLQEDIGFTDMLSKALQVSIILLGSYLLLSIRRVIRTSSIRFFEP
jgi:hypothetical protein